MQFSILFLSVLVASLFTITPTQAGNRHKIRTISDHSILRKREARATFYAVGLGNCGNTNSDSEMVVAIAEPDVAGDTLSRCGQTVSIKNLKTNIVKEAKVVDLCPGCSSGSLDMSPALFKSLGGTEAEGVFPITYSFVGSESNGSEPATEDTSKAASTSSGSENDGSAASVSGSSSASGNTSDVSSGADILGSNSQPNASGQAASSNQGSNEDDSVSDEDGEAEETEDDDDDDDDDAEVVEKIKPHKTRKGCRSHRYRSHRNRY